MTTLMILIYIYMFVLGACLESFINVVIYRVPLGISVAKGRSFCPSCHHQLHALDLIPILSWIFLKGKCRYCHEKIPVRDTLLECVGGLLGMLCFYRFGFDMMTLIALIIGLIFIAISMIDIDTMIIPNGLIVALLVVSVYSILFAHISIVDRVIGFFALSVPLMLLNYLIPDSFGGGDIKLLAVCGLLLGWKNLLVGMFIAVILAGGYAASLMIMKKVKRNDHIAFGPYICLGMFVSFMYGELLLTWYLGLFGL